MLADDVIGIVGERIDESESSPYLAAFEAIDSDPNQLLLVFLAGTEIVGTSQITCIPGLSRGGAWRARVEAVRVAPQARGRGVGGEIFAHIHALALERSCRIIQLTTDKRRTDARRFYERLRFVVTHEGYKLEL